MNQRILLVVPTLSPLGPALQVRALVQHLIEQGHDVELATMESSKSFPMPAVNCHFLRRVGKRDLGMFFRLRQRVQEFQPHWVHAWGMPAINLAGWVLVDQPNVRFLASEWEKRTEPSFVKRQFRRRFRRRPEKLTVPHKSLRKLMLREGVREHRLEIVAPAAVRFLEFSGAMDVAPRTEQVGTARRKLRDRIGVPSEAIVAGTAARLEPNFRLKDLIWAADLLACIRSDFHFCLFGTGFQLDRLKKFLTQTDAAPFVHFVGLPDDCEELLLGLDTYWNSHLRCPCHSLMLAAMRDEIPVVSVLGDGVEDIVISQVSALATNFGARDEFSRWTKYLIEQKDSRDKLARQGAVHAKEHFPLRDMLDGFDRIYHSSP